jgi:hypothetical protein
LSDTPLVDAHAFRLLPADHFRHADSMLTLLHFSPPPPLPAFFTPDIFMITDLPLPPISCFRRLRCRRRLIFEFAIFDADCCCRYFSPECARGAQARVEARVLASDAPLPTPSSPAIIYDFFDAAFMLAMPDASDATYILLCQL